MSDEYRKRPLGLILLVIMVLMGFEAGTKKPLCISSNIVNKIDRVGATANALSDSTSTESIYSCSSYKIPVFSAYFYENLDELNSRLSKIEKTAALLGIKGKLDISIRENTSGELKLQNNVLQVSADKFDDPDFAKLIMSSLISQNMKSGSATFTSFLSGWLTDDLHEESVMEELWQDSYESLSLFEKFRFKEMMYSKLRAHKVFDDKSVTENMLALLDSENTSVQNFKSVFTEKLKNFGLTEAATNFDLVFQNLTNEPVNLENLTALAREHKDKRILFQDSSGLYVLPYMVQLQDSLKSSVTANLRVIYTTDNLRIPVEKYFGNTERLIVFKSKTGTVSADVLNFSSLYASSDRSKNEIALLHNNKKFDVIQFHVPSLKYRQAQLGQIKDFFGLLKNSKSAAKKTRLGWEAEEWSIDAQAFKPVAVYDVIQFYRVN